MSNDVPTFQRVVLFLCFFLIKHFIKKEKVKVSFLKIGFFRCSRRMWCSKQKNQRNISFSFLFPKKNYFFIRVLLYRYKRCWGDVEQRKKGKASVQDCLLRFFSITRTPRRQPRRRPPPSPPPRPPSPPPQPPSLPRRPP